MADCQRSPGPGAQSWTHDLRFGLRMLAKSPGTTAVIIITLAAGLGFNGFVYSLLHTMVLMELPFEEAERIRFVSALDLSRDNWRSSSSYPDFTDFAAASISFESLAVWRGENFTVAEGGELPERIVGAYVSPTIFDVLGVQPSLGRRLSDADGMPEADAVVLVGLWHLAESLRR